MLQPGIELVLQAPGIFASSASISLVEIEKAEAVARGREGRGDIRRARTGFARDIGNEAGPPRLIMLLASMVAMISRRSW